jgi:hypothetical protein
MELVTSITSGRGRRRLAGAGVPARKFFSSLSLKILTPFRINLLIWPFLIFFSFSVPVRNHATITKYFV